MSFLNELKPYQDNAGLVHPPPPKTGSYNGARYTAESVAGAEKLHLLDKPTRLKFLASYMAIEDPSFPGILRRSPGNLGGHQSLDDLIGRLHVAQILPEDTYAGRFIHRAVKSPLSTASDPTMASTPWGRAANAVGPLLAPLIPYVGQHHFNNIYPQHWHIASWMGRFPHVFTHAQLALSQTPPAWRRAQWSFIVIQSSMQPRHKTTEIILAWHLVKVFRRSGVECDMCKSASDTFSWMLETRWPGKGIGGVIQDEFKLPHPNADALMGDFSK